MERRRHRRSDRWRDDGNSERHWRMLTAPLNNANSARFTRRVFVPER